MWAPPRSELGTSGLSAAVFGFSGGGRWGWRTRPSPLPSRTLKNENPMLALHRVPWSKADCSYFGCRLRSRRLNGLYKRDGPGRDGPGVTNRAVCSFFAWRWRGHRTERRGHAARASRPRDGAAAEATEAERGARKSLTRPYKPSDLIRKFIAILPPSGHGRRRLGLV
jgi:hypothetical protein